MTYFISQIYMVVILHSGQLSVAPAMTYFISQIYMRVMWHSGRLIVAYYDLFYFTDLHGCDVAL